MYEPRLMHADSGKRIQITGPMNCQRLGNELQGKNPDIWGKIIDEFGKDSVRVALWPTVEDYR